MKRVVAIVMTISFFATIPLAEDRFTVSGVGAYPVSAGITSMWLAGPDHQPLVMAYFQGPNGGATSTNGRWIQSLRKANRVGRNCVRKERHCESFYLTR